MSAPGAIAEVLGAIERLTPLGGGCVGEVYSVSAADGTRWVAKVDGSGAGTLDVEGFMLDYLATHSDLPVPSVRHAAPELLILEHLPGSTGCSGAAELHAAELLAALHGVASPRSGFERDTLIGSLPQPNPWSDSWVSFFAEHRLMHMVRLGREAGQLPPDTAARIERIASRLERWIDEPDAVSLVHGDVWSGNVLSEGQRVTGLIDPAIYYGHAEVELAFITMFNTFGKRFFDRYRELRPLDDGFFEQRRLLYMLYPILVHVRLFGGSYVGDAEACARRFVS